MDLFVLMKKYTGEGEYVKYIIYGDRRVLSGCLYCQGALFWYSTHDSPDKVGYFKCFHCGRMYQKLNGHIRLWPYKEYEHLTHNKKMDKEKRQESNTYIKTPDKRTSFRSFDMGK